MDLFAKKDRSGASSRIKQWALELLAVDDDASILVTELACTEPGCPPLETVIAILSTRGNRQFKLHRGMAEVTREDVQQLAAGN